MYNYYFCICICKKRERGRESRKQKEYRVFQAAFTFYIQTSKGKKYQENTSQTDRNTQLHHTHYRTPPRTKVFCKCIKILCYLVKI